MALVGGGARGGDGRLREAAAGSGVVEAQQLAVLVVGDELVVGREVDVDAVGADANQPRFAERGFLDVGDAGGDQVRPSSDMNRPLELPKTSWVGGSPEGLQETQTRRSLAGVNVYISS